MKLITAHLVLSYDIMGMKYGSELCLNKEMEMNEQNIAWAIEELKQYVIKALKSGEFYRAQSMKTEVKNGSGQSGRS